MRARSGSLKGDYPYTAPGILKPIERLVDALTDPARGERTALIVLAAYVAVWTLYGVIAKSSQGMHPDAAELAAWSHHLTLGYSKHPPLAAWVVRAWLRLFPISDWSYYLLSISYAAVGLWVSWRLFGRFLDPGKRVVALACLTLVPYFNFIGLRFDHNAVLGALWAATALCFIRSFDTRSAGWAALAGAAAAAAMLGKYWSVFLLAGLAVAALVDVRRGAYFRSAAPWITVAVGTLVLAPHLAWLVRHDFIAFSYALNAHETRTLGHTVVCAAKYLAGGAGYAAVPVLLVLALSRPPGVAFVDMLLPRNPRRRFVAVAFWTLALLPAATGIFFGLEINSIWSMSGLVLLPVVLLSSPLIVLSRQAVTLIVAFTVALPPIMLALSPAIAYAIHLTNVSPTGANGQLLAQRIEQEWRRTTDRPLRIVGDDYDLANVAAFYLPQQPDALPLMEPETAPWVTPERIAREGIALTCDFGPAHQPYIGCHNIPTPVLERIAAANPKSRRVEVTLARSYLGAPGKPEHYLIVIVPPQK
jgi:4-amino-4-deoxy-L-arabinose transferase-like glycosyltransferase